MGGKYEGILLLIIIIINPMRVNGNENSGSNAIPPDSRGLDARTIFNWDVCKVIAITFVIVLFLFQLTFATIQWLIYLNKINPITVIPIRTMQYEKVIRIALYITSFEIFMTISCGIGVLLEKHLVILISVLCLIVWWYLGLFINLCLLGGGEVKNIEKAYFYKAGVLYFLGHSIYLVCLFPIVLYWRKLTPYKKLGKFLRYVYRKLRKKDVIRSTFLEST